MSEYQHYEFIAVDQPLTDTQQRELRALSTRARITPSSFVNDYQWGDLKGDPRAWMERFFDAFLYLANWGPAGSRCGCRSVCSMRRLPRKPKEYEAAIVLLKDLQALAERDGDTATFDQQIWQLRQQHHAALT